MPPETDGAPAPPARPISVGRQFWMWLCLPLPPLLLSVAVPKFRKIFDQIGVWLPAHTQFTTSVPPYVYGLIAVASVVFILWLGNPDVARRWAPRLMWILVTATVIWTFAVWSLFMPLASLNQGLGG